MSAAPASARPPALSVDDLPMFFGPEHVTLGSALRAIVDDFAVVEGADPELRDGVAARVLADHGLYCHVVPTGGDGPGAVDTRAVCLVRELLGYVSPRADSILAVQGLGTYPLQLAGSAEQRALLPGFASGERIAAFALTEPNAGSDVAAIETRAVRTAVGWRLDGLQRAKQPHQRRNAHADCRDRDFLAA